MNNSSLLSFALALALTSVACDQKKPAPDGGQPQSPQSSPNGAPAPPQEEEKGPKRAQYSWEGLQTWDIKDGISPPGSVPSKEESQGAEEGQGAAADSGGTALVFARVAGGEGRFCGALRAGPIQCWGKEPGLHVGAFVDVAVARGGVCGATSTGQVKCFGMETPANLSGVKRVAAAGDNVCTLDGAGKVTCFSAGSSESLSPPVDLKAKYFSVGAGFACAADQESKLQCWGEVAGLNLPQEPPTVRDVAAGDGFVCYLDENSTAKCFGKSPSVPSGTFSSLSAGDAQLCLIDKAEKAVCVGDVEAEFETAKRIAVGGSAVCVLDAEGVAQCKGKDEHAQLSVPVANAEASPQRAAAQAIPQNAFDEFVKLFPEVKLPQSFDRKSTFDVGDRVPMQFAALLGGAANDYRVGVRIPLQSGVIAVTLLHMPTGKLELHTFLANGQPAKFRTLAGRSQQSGALEEQADGTAQRSFTATTTESVIRQDGSIEQTSYEGAEVTHYVREHKDGSRPVSRKVCNITGTLSTDVMDKNGSFSRKNAMIIPPLSTTDAKGCAGAWPLGQ